MYLFQMNLKYLTNSGAFKEIFPTRNRKKRIIESKMEKDTQHQP